MALAISFSIVLMTWAFFFDGVASAAWAPHALRLHLAAEQLATSPGHRVHVQIQQSGDLAIAPMAELLGLETGIQPLLFLVQQTEE